MKFIHGVSVKISSLEIEKMIAFTVVMSKLMSDCTRETKSFRFKVALNTSLLSSSMRIL